MLRLSLIVILLTHRTQTAHITETPSYVNRLDRLTEKLEELTIARDRKLDPSPNEKLYEKLDRLNSLTPDRLDLTEEDEELLSAMHTWGFNPEQMEGMVKDLQQLKEDERTKDIDTEYDSEWNEEDPDSSESDYIMDGDWDADESADSSTISKPHLVGLSPSAIIRASGPDPEDEKVVSAADSIAATNARPRIVANLTPSERRTVRRAAFHSTSTLLKNSKCLEPQPRWLIIRQLAPAADTIYMPPCVQLHRCAPDAGCCINESEVCAPIDGKTVDFPFILQRADGDIDSVKMQFFNHTKCACVSREKLQESMTASTRAGHASYGDMQEEETPRSSDREEPVGRGINGSINDWKKSTEEPDKRTAMNHNNNDWRKSMEEPGRREAMNQHTDWRGPTEEAKESKLETDEEVTAPPQLRRCTCPALFLASMNESELCSCVCDWPDVVRRRDCQSLARGKEHFGLRDRFCVDRGDCTQPSCEFGPYDRNHGQCPQRRFRRMRFHGRGKYHSEKNVLV